MGVIKHKYTQRRVEEDKVNIINNNQSRSIINKLDPHDDLWPQINVDWPSPKLMNVPLSGLKVFRIRQELELKIYISYLKALFILSCSIYCRLLMEFKQ